MAGEQNVFLTKYYVSGSEAKIFIAVLRSIIADTLKPKYGNNMTYSVLFDDKKTQETIMKEAELILSNVSLS